MTRTNTANGSSSVPLTSQFEVNELFGHPLAVSSVLAVNDAEVRIHELTPDRQAIGGHVDERRKQFATKRSAIIPKQRIYLTSDGYYSQFGGPDDKKFMKSRFKDLLETIQSQTMDEQKKLLRKALIEWQGGNEQVDDVIVLGIEL